MIVAELLLVTEGGFGDRGHVHTISFASLETAQAEFDRIDEIFKRKEERKNDLPAMIEVVGDGNRVTIPLGHLRSVGLVDFVHANEQRKGMRDTFPNLFKF